METDRENPILEYWEQIQSGKVTVGKKVRRIYQKLAEDVSRTEGFYHFSPGRAWHAIDFIQNFCRHSKGKMGGQPFLLELWQKAFVAAVFGFIDDDGNRQYRKALLVVARKNGKSTLSAAIGLYLMLGDGEPGAEVYSVATKKDQAKIIWLEAKKMVKKSPLLLSKIKPLVAEMVCEYNESVYKPLGHDSETQDGLNVHGALMDETHAWSPDLCALYDVIADGTTAREQPVILITTTAGTVRGGQYDRDYEEAERIIAGYDDPEGYHDDRTLPVIYELDSRKEWTDERCWQKANPGLGTIKSRQQLAEKVRRAAANPALVKNLVCKDFNIPETTGGAWLTFEQLNNPETFRFDELHPAYAIGGADLSSTTDLTAAVVLFRVPGDNRLFAECMFWLPAELLDRRVQEDKIPYDLWEQQGWLRVSEGSRVNYRDVTAWFAEIMQEHDCYLYNIGYDAWSAAYWVDDMKMHFGDILLPVQQTMKILSDPMKCLGAELEAKRVVYNNNPILKWCLANTAALEDKNGNIKPAKTASSRKRIDGLAALLDAYVVYCEHQADYEAVAV